MTSPRRPARRRLFRESPVADVDRELAFHIDMRARELVEQGWDEASARSEARRLFGDYGQVRSECITVASRYRRAARRTTMLSELRQDIGYALRWLARERGFAVLTIVTLALGIGATSAAFAIVNGVLLAPLPYAEPGRLVALWERTEAGVDNAVAWPNYADLRAETRTLSGLAAYQAPATTTVLGGAEPVLAGVARVTGNLFDVLGVQPAVGRGFGAEERVRGGSRTVVVSHGFWRRQLGATTELEGVRLQAGGISAPVIGVMPPGFDFPRGTDVWVSLDIEDPAGLGARSAKNFRAVGRLAAGVGRDGAQRELSGIARRIHERVSDSNAVAVSLYDLREQMVGRSRRALYILLGASTFVLLVACTNLAGALLGRAARRSRELAVRASLGAHRLRLVRQLLTESVVLAALGGLAGLGLAGLLVRGVTVLGPDAVPRLAEVRLDGWVLAFTSLIAMGTALTFGTAPAVRATAVEPFQAMRQGGGGTDAPRQRRAWSLLVATEVALALLLLVGSGLLMRSFHRVTQVDPGFDVANQLAVAVSLPPGKYGDGAARARFYDLLLERVRGLPGVEHAAITMTVPLVSFDPSGLFDIEGGVVGDGDAHYRVVSPGFFATTRTPVIRGRTFTAADRAGAPDVILINEQLAERYFASVDPIGKRMRTGGMDSRGFDFAEIVGIVGDVRFRSIDAPPQPAYYLTYAQRTDRIAGMTLLVRTAGRPLALGAAVRAAVREIDSDVAIEVATLRHRVGEAFAPRRFALLVLGAFAVVALILAAVGIYGVVSFAVAHRTREIGIRVALGAGAQRVLWTVSRDTMIAVAAGLAGGLIAAAALTRLIASLLFQTPAVDPLTYTAVALLLLATAWLAVLVPARRATRVDPMTALRGE
jgi:putative ABC transport system permease protein